MSKISGPLSGFRDFLMSEMLIRDDLISKITKVYRSYGFSPLKTPALERYDLLNGKYGDEGQKLMYNFKDQGGREVALRYDLTVPLARVVTNYQNELPTPYRRYAVGEVWRGERPQKGRYREFTQIDADIVGSKCYLCEVEILSMISDIFKELDTEIIIRVNDRRILDALAKRCSIPDSQFLKFINIIDRIEKEGLENSLNKIQESFSADVKEIVREYMSINGTTESKLENLMQITKDNLSAEVVTNLSKIFKILKITGINNVVFDQSIARGLDYYSGLIFETNLVNMSEIGSVCSGGRYDNLIASSGGPDITAIGASVGLDRLIAGLDDLGKINKDIKTTEVYVCLMDEDLVEDTFALVQTLRRYGINAEMSYEVKSLSKQLERVNKLGISKVLIYGLNEKKTRKIVVKDMKNGDQQEIDVTSIIDYLKN